MTSPGTLTAPSAAAAAPSRAGSFGARTLLVLACFVVCLQSLPANTGFVMPVLLLVAGTVAVAACVRAGKGQGLADRVPGWLVGVLVLFGLSVTGLKLGALAFQQGLPAVVAAAGLVVYLGLGYAAAFDSRRWFLRVFVCLHVAVVCLAVATVKADIDVWQFLQQGAHALLNGGDPYAIRIANPYTPAEAARYYSPGVVVDGRLVYGFPYLPMSLLTVVPGFLVGDVRYGELALLLLATLLVLRLATDRAGRALAVLVLAGPTSVSLVLNAWVEPTLMVGLAVLTAGALGQRWRSGALGLVMFLAAKQYVVVVLPLLATLRRLIGPRGVMVGLAATVLVLLPFAAVDPNEFYRSVVEFHLRQPFRPDSVSLLVSSVRLFGWPPAQWYGPLPLVAGFASSALLCWKLPRTALSLVVSVGVTLLVTVLLSKQAFSNYYSLIGFAFLLGAVIWPSPAAHEPR